MALKITPQELKTVRMILDKHIPHTPVLAFGSRVHGTPKKHSDLDLALMTDAPLSPLLMSNLREDFEESNLVFRVDLVDWSYIHDSFKKVILANAISIQ